MHYSLGILLFKYVIIVSLEKGLDSCSKYNLCACLKLTAVWDSEILLQTILVTQALKPII